MGTDTPFFDDEFEYVSDEGGKKESMSEEEMRLNQPDDDDDSVSSEPKDDDAEVSPFATAEEVKESKDSPVIKFTKEMKIAVLIIEKAWCKYKRMNEDLEKEVGFEMLKSFVS